MCTSQNVVEGQCALCATSIKMILGEKVDRVRWVLAEKVYCAHCELDLYYALRDGYGRYWGRRKVWND